jgi:hypothetical protein
MAKSSPVSLPTHINTNIWNRKGTRSPCPNSYSENEMTCGASMPGSWFILQLSWPKP